MSELVCRICNNNDNNSVYTAKEINYGLGGEFIYYQCYNCGCLQIKEFPQHIADFYPADYYSLGPYEGKKFKGFLGGIKKFQYRTLIDGDSLLKAFLEPLTGSHNYHIFKDLKLSKNSRILDVGCGNGKTFLYPLAEIGFTDLKGCDPFINAPITYDNGLTILKSNIFDMDGSWDIITYHHAFEHVANPKEHLKAIKKLLKPNGICVIRIPTVSSYAWHHFGVDWVQLDAPRHFFLHSVESMTYLAEEADLNVYEIKYDSNYFQFTGSENSREGKPLNNPRPNGLSNLVKRKFNKYRYNKKAIHLNKISQGDQAAFYLKNNTH